MWRSGNWSINVEPYDTFHWPGWDQKGLEMMFERELSFPNALCHHLWESHCFEQYFAGDSKAIASRIRTGRSTYSRLARPYI
jgi:hypothetical protein